jgi:UDP-glucuronate decarboxylase
MKIGIIGYGFVGKATSLFQHPSFQYYIYDLDSSKRNPQNITLKQMEECDILFIALPTPMNIDGSCDTSNIENVLKQISHQNIVIRSTVPVGFCDKYNVFFMPEFLTEKNWKQDFIENKFWVIGTTENRTNKNLVLEEIIQLSKSNASIFYDNIIYLSNKEAELVKLVKNTYLATKVSFFNEIYDLTTHKNINYQNVIKVVGLDQRIGKSHMTVPNDDKRGYGGTCFPKDTNNIYSLFQDSNLKSYLLEANLKRNEFIDRPQRDWLSDRNRTNTSIQGKIVLITGGAGFIGSNLCHRMIQDGHKVICIDNLSTGRLGNIQDLMNHPNFVFKKHDITKTLFIPRVDEIYHLACPASPPQYQKEPLKTIKTSIKGIWNVLKICKQQRCKLLFTSTSEIYGDPLEHPQKEEYWGNVNPIGTRSCYDESKRLSETIIYEYRKKHKLDLKIVRIFNTYGPNMDLNDGRIITNVIRAGLQGLPLTINGNGNQTRSFCYVDDMVEGLVRMMGSKEEGPINLGNPKCEFTINELVRLYEEISGKKLEIKYELYDNDDPKQRKPDISKAKERLGWEPKIDLENGLKKFNK